MGLTPKQEEFYKAFRSKQFDYMMAAGTTGSGKSIATLGLLHVLCCNMKNLRFAVIRKSEKNLKQTTIPSYRKIKNLSRSSPMSVISDMTARYPTTGSEILFIWADITKDPDLDNVKGLEITGALMEESNQIDKAYFDLLKTRIGRHGSDKCHPFIMLNMNPTQGWCKELFYDNHVSGTMPERHYFLEFTKEDIHLEDENSTIKFKQMIEDLPPDERSRFVYNNWDYGTIPNQLISYEWYKNCCVDEYYIKNSDRGLLALDPADQGVDATEIAMMHGSHIGWWESFPKQDPGDSAIIAYERATEYGISEKDVIYDCIGVGAGSTVAFRTKKFYPTKFVSGESPILEPTFLRTANKRAEAHWLLREAFRNGDITIKHHPKFQKECTKMTYSVDDRVIKIMPKETAKLVKNIGWSPGKLDCAAMLYHRYFTSNNELAKEIMDKQANRLDKYNGKNRLRLDRIKRMNQHA